MELLKTFQAADYIYIYGLYRLRNKSLQKYKNGFVTLCNFLKRIKS